MPEFPFDEHDNEVRSSNQQAEQQQTPQQFRITQSLYQYRRYLVTALTYEEAMQILLEDAPVNSDVSFFAETDDVKPVPNDAARHEVFFDESSALIQKINQRLTTNARSVCFVVLNQDIPFLEENFARPFPTAFWLRSLSFTGTLLSALAMSAGNSSEPHSLDFKMKSHPAVCSFKIRRRRNVSRSDRRSMPFMRQPIKNRRCR